jgi:hypothetical protein
MGSKDKASSVAGHIALARVGHPHLRAFKALESHENLRFPARLRPSLYGWRHAVVPPAAAVGQADADFGLLGSPLEGDGGKKASEEP